MTTATEPTPASAAERTVLLDADLERVVEALRSPDLLGAWLGTWTPDGDDSSSATVVTDDGRTRRVEHLAPTPDGAVRWRWAPVADPTLVSEVRFTVTREAGRTRLTVTETLLAGHGASATAPSTPWLGSLLALGAVLAVGSLIAV